MRTEKFDKIQNKKMRKLYNGMWRDNPVAKEADTRKTIAKNGEGELVHSENSFAFAIKDEAEILIRTFGINKHNEEIFRNKLNMACNSLGHGGEKITTMHSSALCALLFFYNVSENNKLHINGVGTFSKSVFEYKSPVINANSPACMDVVLIGENEDKDKVVMFLKSKFSEYYTSTSRCHNHIRKRYQTHRYSENIYKQEFMHKLGTSMHDENEYYFKLKADEEYYMAGIKQMISCYVGIRNDMDPSCGFIKQNDSDQDEVSKMIATGAKIILAEIVFDKVIGDMLISNNKTYLESYSEKYEILANKMNEEIEADELSDKLYVLPNLLKYSMFQDEDLDYILDEKVKMFYFGHP